jgi:hypothetical protein
MNATPSILWYNHIVQIFYCMKHTLKGTTSYLLAGPTCLWCLVLHMKHVRTFCCCDYWLIALRELCQPGSRSWKSLKPVVCGWLAGWLAQLVNWETSCLLGLLTDSSCNLFFSSPKLSMAN